MNTVRDRVVACFRETFHAEPALLARAPGRVNLLGEHIDYNEGYVLPAAIDRETWLAFRRHESDHVVLHAADLSQQADFLLRNVHEKLDRLGQPLPAWALYPAGVAWSLLESGLEILGMQCVYASNVPVGAGLSSSASVETAFAAAWQALGGWSRPPMELARICQRAENRYAGVNCGIMDQFASGCGQADHALFLDCRTHEWQPVPLPLEVAIVVADTTVRRQLAASEYNSRRAQCEEAVGVLKKTAELRHIAALRDVSPEQFQQHAHLMTGEVARRARYVVEECARMPGAVELLRQGRIADFGRLMNACHDGLRDDYEVSCPELDVMVEAAQSLEGCYGARLTGAGFGGCTVNLVDAHRAESFRAGLAGRYEQATGRHPEIYICRAAAGASIA